MASPTILLSNLTTAVNGPKSLRGCSIVFCPPGDWVLTSIRNHYKLFLRKKSRVRPGINRWSLRWPTIFFVICVVDLPIIFLRNKHTRIFWKIKKIKDDYPMEQLPITLLEFPFEVVQVILGCNGHSCVNTR